MHFPEKKKILLNTWFYIFNQTVSNGNTANYHAISPTCSLQDRELALAASILRKRQSLCFLLFDGKKPPKQKIGFLTPYYFAFCLVSH